MRFYYKVFDIEQKYWSMEIALKLFLVVCLILQSEVFCLPSTLSDVLKRAHVNEDRILVDPHYSTGYHLTVRPPNILKPVQKIRNSDFLTLPKHINEPQKQNISSTRDNIVNSISQTQKKIDTEIDLHAIITRDTNKTRMIIETEVIKAKQLIAENSTNSASVKHKSFNENNPIDNKNTKFHRVAKHPSNRNKLQNQKKQEEDGIIIFRDDDNDIRYNEVFEKVITTAIDLAGDTTTEDYETTTFDDDNLNRMGAVPPAVVASLLG